MRCKHIIHVNSPTWGSDDAEGLLQTAVQNILIEAGNAHLKTVALPSISSGKYDSQES